MALFAGSLVWALTTVAPAAAAEGPITYMGCLTGDSNVAAASTVGTNSCLGLATVGAEGAGTGLDGLRSVAVSPDGLSVYGASQDDDAVVRFNRAADGSLTYQGCITAETGLVGINGCVGMPTTQTSGNQTALDQPTSVAVSPDGDSVYVGSAADSAIVVFDRAAGGALTYRECFSSESALIDPAPTDCGVAGAVSVDGEDTGFGSGPGSIAVSPDGKSVYTVSLTDASITRFDRAPDGSLDWEGCISTDSAFNTPDTLGFCLGLETLGAMGGEETGFDRPTSVAVSPDGDSVYVATANDASVVRLDRAASGALTYQGCVTGDGAVAAASATGVNGCVGLETVGPLLGDGANTGLDSLQSIAVAPDGDDVYAGSLDDAGIARFARGGGGSLTYADCVTADSAVAAAATTGVNDCAGISAIDAGLQSVRSIAISPDGDSVYGASQNEGAVTRFDRAAGGSLTHQGCITSDQDVSPSGVTSPSGCLGLPTTTSDPANTGLDFLHSIMVSPDGDSVYAVARDDAAVIRLNREDDPPDTAIDAGPQGATSDNSPTFGFSSSEPNSVFECAVDAQPFASCGGVASGSATTPALADGSHVFRVRADDGFGDLDASPATRNFAIDTQAPDTLFSGKPRAKLKTKKARARLTLAFTSTEPGSSFECAVGSAPFAPCTSPLIAQLKAKKGKGKAHTIQVRAVDALGNRDASAASLSVKAVRR